jgi:hypothetical protein
MDSTATVDIEEAKAISGETEEDFSMEAGASSDPLAHLKVRETIPMLSVEDSIRVAKDLLDPEPHPLSEALQNALRKRLMEIEAEKRARGRE